LALVQLDEELRSAGLHSRLVLQVHDEVIVESPVSEIDEASAIILRVLTGVTSMTVPLEVSLAVGDSWADAKG
jgi:DNA polymerase-1